MPLKDNHSARAGIEGPSTSLFGRHNRAQVARELDRLCLQALHMGAPRCTASRERQFVSALEPSAGPLQMFFRQAGVIHNAADGFPQGNVRQIALVRRQVLDCRRQQQGVVRVSEILLPIDQIVPVLLADMKTVQ
jgi:hypothetical protein